MCNINNNVEFRILNSYNTGWFRWCFHSLVFYLWIQQYLLPSQAWFKERNDHLRTSPNIYIIIQQNAIVKGVFYQFGNTLDVVVLADDGGHKEGGQTLATNRGASGRARDQTTLDRSSDILASNIFYQAHDVLAGSILIELFGWFI